MLWANLKVREREKNGWTVAETADARLKQCSATVPLIFTMIFSGSICENG